MGVNLREPVGKEGVGDGVVANQVALRFGYDSLDTRFTGDGACCVEVGGGLSGEGNFPAPPAPHGALHEPAPGHHTEKQQQESDWLARWNS